MTSYFRQTGVPTARDQHAHRAGQPAHVRLSRVQRRASRPVTLGDLASGSYIQLSVTKLVPWRGKLPLLATTNTSFAVIEDRF